MVSDDVHLYLCRIRWTFIPLKERCWLNFIDVTDSSQTKHKTSIDTAASASSRRHELQVAAGGYIFYEWLRQRGFNVHDSASLSEFAAITSFLAVIGRRSQYRSTIVTILRGPWHTLLMWTTDSANQISPSPPPSFPLEMHAPLIIPRMQWNRQARRNSIESRLHACATFTFSGWPRGLVTVTAGWPLPPANVSILKLLGLPLQLPFFSRPGYCHNATFITDVTDSPRSRSTHNRQNEYKRTWSVGSYSCWIGSRSERCSRFQFSVGELREVGHHTQFVNLWVYHLLRSDQLKSMT